ncbi:MAG: hypothetical protein RBU37_23120, partial [Myxococcota bacterium]|nr:hypothetical protein [Myxococcota bacterium]
MKQICIRSLSRDPRSAAQAHRMRPRQTLTPASRRSLVGTILWLLFFSLMAVSCQSKTEPPK